MHTTPALRQPKPMRKSYEITLILSAILFLGSLACNLPLLGGGGEATPLPQATQTVPAEVEPSETALPVDETPASLPVGVLVGSGDSRIRLLDLQGNLLSELGVSKMGEYLQLHSIAGNSPDGSSMPALFLHNRGDDVMYYYDSGSELMLPWGSATAAVLVPGTTSLAITKILSSDVGVTSELYVTSGVKLSSASPVFTYEGSTDEWLAIMPLALDMENDLPVGVWYTLMFTGPGGDAIYPLLKGLYYLNLANGQSSEVLADTNNPNSISPDLTWAAVSASYSSTESFLKLYNLKNGQEVNLPLDPANESGAGFAQISPDSSKVAWMEASGSFYMPDLKLHLRIASSDGILLHDFDGTMIYEMTSVQLINRIAPVAWLDPTTLLVEASGLYEDEYDAELWKVNTDDWSITSFSCDAFIGLVYQGQNDAIPEQSEGAAIQAFIPEAPLSMTGPWVVVPTQEHMWTINLDGSGKLALINQASLSWFVQKVAASPQGGYLAFTATYSPDSLRGLTLLLTQIPNGHGQIITELTSPDAELSAEAQVCDPNYEAARAATMGSGLAWSPDGSQLAFIGAQDGPTADLYVYSLETEQIVQVTDGPSQAYNPVWSPDGKYIVHFGASCFGTGAGFAMMGAWAASPDGKDVFSLYDIDPHSAGEDVVGWLSDDEVVVETYSGCPAENLRKVNLDTKVVTPIYAGCYYDAVMAPDGTLALVVDEDIASDGKGGIFIFPPSGAEPLNNPDLVGDELAYSDEYGAFFLRDVNEQVRSFDFEGNPGATLDIGTLPHFSSSSAWWAADTIDGLVIGGESSSTARMVYPGIVMYPLWTRDPVTALETLLFFGGADFDHMGFYAAYPPAFEPLAVSMSAFPNWLAEPVWLNP